MSVSVLQLTETTSVQEALAVLRAHGIRARYENFIGGKWVAPVKGEYFVDSSPIDGEPLCEVARSSAADIEKALDAAHAAKDAWGHTAPAVRAKVLNQIADRMEKIWSFWLWQRLWITANRSAKQAQCGRTSFDRSFPVLCQLHSQRGGQRW